MEFLTKVCLLLSFLAIARAQNVATPVGLCTSASANSVNYTRSPSNTILSYITNIQTNWTPDVANSVTNPTLNLGPGSRSLLNAVGSALLVGEIIAGGIYVVVYDGTALRVIVAPLDQIAPKITACGTLPVITGTDRGGTVTVGSAATGCTITFHIALLVVGSCTVTSQAGIALTYSPSLTGIVVTGALSSTKINYVCNK